MPEGAVVSEETPLPAALDAGGVPRLRQAQRDQVEFRAASWNDLLPDDHQARIVWQYAETSDLSELYSAIKAVERRPGHPPIDPRILFTLWIYATLRGIGSARELARRCESDLPFQWICGGVSVNYHTLADFRVAHVQFLDGLLTSSVAVLLHQRLVTLDRVAQDGMKVRASAGAASFRREKTLQACLQQAREQLDRLSQEQDADPAAANRRLAAARERSAEDRARRMAKALEELPLVREKKSGPAERENARVSMTDPEARVMKMPDNGFRPAYNVQLATDTQTQIVTGVEVTNLGSDQGQLAPMIEQHGERYDQVPEAVLVDGGFVKKADIDQLTPPQGGTVVYAPVMKSHDPNRDPHTPRDDDSPAVAAWRMRMSSPEAKEIYKERASTAECVNAQLRNCGLYQVRVRGTPKVLAVVLWHVLAHNLMRTVALSAAEWEGSGIQ